jgi:hypothetical protein
MHDPHRHSAAFPIATTTIFVSLILCAPALAQITVTNATFPAAGDTLKMAIDNSPGTIVAVYTPPGGSQVWDLSGLHVDSTQDFVFRAASEGSVSAQVPGAELVTVLSHNTEEYYNVTSSRFEVQASYGIQPYDLVSNALFAYNPPLTERQAPLNFFDFYQSSSGILEEFPPSAFPPTLIAAFSPSPDSLRYRVSISRIDVVDGWGKLSIPGGTYDVLREKRTQYRETRLDAKITPLGWLDVTDMAISAGSKGLGVDTTVSISFYNNMEKETIARVTLNSAQNAATHTWFKYNPPVTSVAAAGTNVPGTIVLYDNYPNPFNPSTTIRYRLPILSSVTVSVFNTLGQLVATLVQREQDAGYHEIAFDARDLASGVYLYRLQAGEFVKSKKLILLR